MIKIKALTVNKAHRTYNGRILKSREYHAYEQELFYLLPKLEVPDCKLILNVRFGLSSKLSDLDNLAKPFIDILQKKYNFNDRMIYKLTLVKEDVKKGDEYIDFEISSY